jgi:hypothetical protein
VAELRALAKGRVISFGLAVAADYRAVSINKTIAGQNFETESVAGHKHETITRYGDHHLYAALAGEIIKHYVAEEAKSSAARLEPEEVR